MNEAPQNYRYFLYARKSSESEERQALSIDSQKEKAESLFPHLKIIELLEESKSAFTPDERPVFDSMLERIKAGEADGTSGIQTVFLVTRWMLQESLTCFVRGQRI
jgi:DNA phosphorothioation-dependent restriction protein DptG